MLFQLNVDDSCLFDEENCLVHPLDSPEHGVFLSLTKGSFTLGLIPLPTLDSQLEHAYWMIRGELAAHTLPKIKKSFKNKCKMYVCVSIRQ